MTVTFDVEQGGNHIVIIAEAGVNHNGDPELAHALVDAAAASGADVVKFQTFSAEELVAADTPTTPYQQEAGQTDQRDMLEGLTLPRTIWAELKSHADEAGIGFLSTPFDVASAKLLADFVDAFKVPSGELTNLAYIRELAGMGKPLLISTGMGSLEEVGAALRAGAEAPSRALFHCISAYPAPEDQLNLLAIPSMFREFGLPVGWSDHTAGDQSAVASVALGARLFEKHLTLDRNMEGPDHKASLEPAQLASYVGSVRTTVRMLGDGVKRLMPTEAENAVLVRRSWHAARDLSADHVISEGDLVALRPESGLRADVDPSGKILRRPLRRGEALGIEDVETTR